MKRKIKITSKMIKKTVLWAILVVLVVGLGIVVVQSFGNDHILSNNTQLQDVDYSDEYRLYLEKQLVTKSSEAEYEDIISDRIVIEREKTEIAQAKKLEDLKAEYEQKKVDVQKQLEKDIEEYTKEAEEDKAKVDADNKKTEEQKESEKTAIDKALQVNVAALEKLANDDIKDINTELNVAIGSHESETKDFLASIDEEYAVVGIVNEILNGRTLTEVLKLPENTPTGYVYSRIESENTAIKAEFDSEKTELANTDGSVKGDTLSGLSFKLPDNTEYIYSGKTGSVVYNVNIPVAGYYNLLLDYVPYSSTAEMKADNEAITEVSGGAAIERIIKVDGNVPFNDLGNISCLRSWTDGGSKFIDATGNEIKPRQIEITQRLQQYLKDSVGYVTEPYLVYFEAGNHEIEIESVKENMGIANLYVTSKENYKSYADYSSEYAGKSKIVGGIAYKLEGEGGDSQYYANNKVENVFNTEVIRSSSTIYGISDRTSAYNSMMKDGEQIKASPVKIVLNSIGGTKWSNPGDWISWKIDVKESGLYQISLRAKQNISRGLFSSRKLSIDGAVPFAEAMNCKFVYGSDWSIVTLGDNQEGYYFYFEKGEHTITLECTLGDYATQIARIQGVIDDLNGVYRKIIQKTGISPDPYMDYFKNESGKKIIAEAQEVFKQSVETLNDVSAKITQISGEKSSETASLETMAIQLNTFIKQYRNIQKNLNDFSTNISSLGTWILNVSQQALTIDYIMVHSDDYELPKANPNFFGGLWFGVRGFFGSFFFDYESVGLTTENEGWESIDVWLCTSESQGREQANAISAMISEACEDENSKLYGLNVKLKVVSSDVLLTATLAGRGPDVAINIGNGTPVNYALRGAAYNLNSTTEVRDSNGVLTQAAFTREYIDKYFANSTVDGSKIQTFQEIALAEELELNGGTRRFQHSALTPYQFNGGYYALPYTQSYLMTFYRTDMFEEYGWKVPETWTDVIQLIPELQIMNFQFYLPLNTAGASSVVNQIFASHLYQNVDDIYQAFYRIALNEYGEEYIESNFDSVEAQEAFEFWCSFYTDYSFPMAASFLNRFRSGETPIGIVGYDMYNTLAVSAPEIRGKWDFALLPGTLEYDENGNQYVDHQGAASGMSMMMMGTTKKPYEAWVFMDWFTDADTQVTYAREIEAILGAAARHNTANVAAFTRLAWSESEKEVLMAQWVETVGVPEVAGGYYTGRNLENAFREVVNNNFNPRQILSDYIRTINSEIDRKREEFGLASSTKKSDPNKWGNK